MKYFKFIFASIIILYCCNASYAQKQKVWIDADSGNETDDIYAIVRALYAPSIEVIGLSSAHFNNADLIRFKKWNQYNTDHINTVQISQKLNEEVLHKTGRQDIAHPTGADRQMGRAWGGSEPRDSEAAQQIINTVKKLNKNEKLVVICLGALTNIASAISIDSTIAKHIVCYMLGAQYNAKKAFWNKSEFNIRNDLNAFDYLLDNANVDLVVMPITTAMYYKFKRDLLYAELSNDSPVKKMLKDRWIETNPNDKIRTLWDLALVEAYLNPDMISTKEVLTPPENTQRIVKVIIAINADFLKRDFLKTLSGH